MAGWGPPWTQNASCASSASASLVAAASCTLMRCGCGVVAAEDAEVDVVGVLGCACAIADDDGGGAEDITKGLTAALLVAVAGVEEDEVAAGEGAAGSDLDDLDLRAV